MSEPSVTKSGYVRQILGSFGNHRREAVMALVFVITLTVIYLWIGGGPALVGSLLPLVMAMIMLQFMVASWRVYRNQQNSITAKLSVVDLDAFDRAKSEQGLRTHYDHREQRLEQRYEANLKRLDKSIEALTARLGGDR